MITLKSINYITCDDVYELTGYHWSDMEFAQMAENDSYQILDCSDGTLEEMYEEFEDAVHGAGLEMEDFRDGMPAMQKRSYPCRLKKQIELIEILRKAYGVRSSILIWISW